ncbi:unnamed protein product [Adineta steineri]|uniref:Carrier domain-containing protein n=1 Tax=Adineta steineri TaxID=433720 RepID=A0A814U9I6_9BILA|nr:unnamed protein product [Adineta steineri]CAF1399428.1 unnamed protein product [Adineta steineri]
MTTLSGPERPDLFKDEFLQDIFIQTAKCFPNKIALRWQNEEITYYQLHQRAMHLASVLQQMKNIGVGDRVGIWLARSAQLHITILAVLMTGATYVPFDADAPQERVNEILDDLQIVILLVDSRASILHPLAFNVEHLHENLFIVGNINQKRVDTHRNLPAYIICTSGSTGKPKAIAISHRSICHFIRADNEMMQIKYEDIVYQGSSAAFDMFLEETFLSYSVGATLVIASKMDILKSDQLHNFFIHHSITVLFCVPTLLLLMHNDPALKLRLINTGGEACPQTLVDRWWKEDRIVFNSYGPTEITVAATVQSLRPGQPISIGAPLPNYVCCLLDEVTGQPTSEIIGELCIRGPGIALGYVNRESLTKEKFTEYGYRTGDRVSIQFGQIFFHERIDLQVKLRGFRIELDEIEHELLRFENRVVSAAVAVLYDQLIAFIVGELSELQMREELRHRLPSYMVPDRLVKIDGAMPRLSSGKIDRKALATLLVKDDIDKLKVMAIEIEPERNTTNELDSNRKPLDIVLSAFQKSFPHKQPKPDDNFFIDLGGHSLIAALTITELRQWFPSIALHDLYECRTAAKLAERLTLLSDEKKNETTLKIPNTCVKPSYTRIILCSVYQAIVVLILGGIVSLELILPYIIFVRILHDHHGIGYACLGAYGILFIVPLFRHLFSLIIKWILIGRYKEGDFPLWGWMYVRWWTVEQLRNLAMPETFADSPLMSIYYQLFGAKIGRNVHLGSINCEAPDLLEIDDDTTISSEVHFQTAFVEDYTLKFRRIYIEKNVYIGSRSVLGGETRMKDNSELNDLSFLPPAICIPAGEVWHGSPATYSHCVDSRAPPNSWTNTKTTSIGTTIIFSVIVLLFIPLFYFIPIIPGLILFEYINLKSVRNWIQIFIFSPLVGILYTCLVIIQIIAVRYLIAGKPKVGIYSTKSLVYIRKWLFDGILAIALHIIHTFYATLYMIPFLRALGLKIGRHCEVSTAVGMVHSLIEIDDECFIADGVLLCNPHIQFGQIHFQKTTIGKRVFIGNTAIIPDGKQIPNECLIGCMSLLADGLQTKQSCFGSPAFVLPNREQPPPDTSETSTYQPNICMVCQRLCIDTIRIFLPRIIIVIEIGIATEIFDHFNRSIHFIYCLLLLPIIYMAIFVIPSLVFCISLKWLLIRKYRKNHYPLWSWFVWTSDFVTVTYEQLAVPLILEFLQGTYFIAPILRCFGAKIGHHCFINTTQITEFDLIHIGNQVVINTGVELQTHLFEDRVMKMGEVCVEDRTNIGCLSVMLPDTRLDLGSVLGPLSLVMKGEDIPPYTSWQGIPIREYN